MRSTQIRALFLFDPRDRRLPLYFTVTSDGAFHPAMYCVPLHPVASLAAWLTLVSIYLVRDQKKTVEQLTLSQVKSGPVG